jgi:predicted ATPase
VHHLVNGQKAGQEHQSRQIAGGINSACCRSTIAGDEFAMQEIADWLEKLGHRQYAQSSAENAIDLSVLPDQDLEKIGVLLGHRRKLLRAIAELDGAAVTAPPVPHVLPVTRAPLPAAAVATVASRIFGAHALWYMGYPDRGLRQCQEALTFARALDHPPTLAFVSQIAMHHQLRGEALPAEKHAEVALDLARRHDFKFWLSRATISHGWAAAAQGREQGLDEIRRGIDAYRATGAELEGSVWAAMLADALLRHGRAQEALAILADAVTKASISGVRPHLAELHRLNGEALAQSGALHEEAVASFQRAVEVAQEQGAKSLELRAATSMARLWRDQGKVQQARELLAPVYDWFTEGFDTLDLKEAKALLDELHA